MPFVFATAGKSNFITLVTGVSHERLQVFHRWIAYAMYTLALLHTFPFIVFHIWKGDMVMQWNTSLSYWTGVVALVAQTWLTFASFAPLRNLVYEWFKISHFIAGTVFMVFFFIHCDFTLSTSDYFIATGVVLSLTWLHRNIRMYFEHGIGLTATVSLASNGFVRVSVPTRTTWRVGQHYFVRFLSLGLHACSSHPFTACSLPTRHADGETKESELIFYIRPQAGLTARLAKHAEKHGSKNMRVLLDGPYGGCDMQKIVQSDRLVVLAGGSGAGWALPLLHAYLRRLEMSTDRAPTMHLILATRNIATCHWFEETVADILKSSTCLGHAPPGLDIHIHYTGSEHNAAEPKVTGQFLSKLEDPEKAPLQHASETASNSDSNASTPSLAAVSKCTNGRPDVPALLASEAAACGSDDLLSIFVCGPVSMQNDASNAAASQQLSIMKGAKKDIYLHMEHFSWA